MRRGASQIDYFQTEAGSIKKKWTGKLPVALVFPNVYAVGMSNLGLQLIYQLLNEMEDVVCERFFLPEKKEIPKSIESQRPLRDFPIVLFSISFEQDYFNVISILRSSGIEPYAADRDSKSVKPGSPLVLGGGVATFMNPEPLAPYVDLFLIGEAEGLLNKIIEYINLNMESRSKGDLLFEIASQQPSCYVPQFYDFLYKQDGSIKGVFVKQGLPEKITRSVHKAPKQVGHSFITSPAAEFSDMFITELGRGCSRGCRFCAAGYVYRPPRLWESAAVINAFENRPEDINRVGLLGMEMVSDKNLDEILNYLHKHQCDLSFSSLRADRIDSKLLQLLRESNIKTVTIAPDGGSERLRKVINKGLTEDSILAAVRNLFTADIQNIKLYFMLGLPTEQMEDLEEMVALVFKMKELMLQIGREKGRLGQLVLSVNNFVPKPWTPFQYHPFQNIKILQEKNDYLRSCLGKVANIKLQIERPENSLKQAMLARGDRRIGDALGRLKNEKKWLADFIKQGLTPEKYAYRQRKQDEFFPWDIIDHHINKQYLWDEYQRALAEKSTQPCDTDICKRCGVCN